MVDQNESQTVENLEKELAGIKANGDSVSASQPSPQMTETSPVASEISKPLGEKQNNFRKILLPILATILIVLAFLSGALLVIRLGRNADNEENVPLYTSEPTPVLDETDSWDRLEDNTMGFSIKYPPGWEVGDTLEDEVSKRIIISGQNREGESVKFEIGFYKNEIKRDESLEDYEIRRVGPATPSAEKEVYETLRGDLYTYKRFINLSSKFEDWDKEISYVFQHNFQYDKRVYFANGYTNDPQKDEEFFDQIVSTMEFMSATPEP